MTKKLQALLSNPKTLNLLSQFETLPGLQAEFLTDELLAQLPPLYSQDGNKAQTQFFIRFFHNSVNMTWYISEFDGEETFFGLASINGYPFEWGYINLQELLSAPMKMAGRTMNIAGVERDICFKPCQMHEIKELDEFRQRLGYDKPATQEESTPQQPSQELTPEEQEFNDAGKLAYEQTQEGKTVDMFKPVQLLLFA